MNLLWSLLLLATGVVAPRIEVLDHHGRPRSFPDGKQAILLIYEDQEGGKQNPTLKRQLSEINRSPQNRAKVEVIAIADLSKWDWWPARNHALADIRKIASEKQTTIYIDWKGAAHKAWGLKRGQNSLVLLDPAGRVRFASAGPLSDAQTQQLLALLAELGLVW